MSKRPDGALEHDIMVVLWSSDRPLPPGEINELLASGLAYTSVATVLGRLVAKGLVARDGAGRAFVYRAVVTEAELAAIRIRDVIDATSNPEEVLAGFVRTLSARDARALRALLGDTAK